MDPYLLLKLNGPGFGLLWILLLVIDILIIYWVLKSHKAFTVKIVWIVLVIVLPLIGAILYFFLGREKR